MKTKRVARMKLWIGVALLAGAVWTGAALGGVFAGDSTTAPPPNNDFANAFVLTGSNVTRLVDTNVDATLEVNEPNTVAGSPALASVWYVWTAPANGQVVIDLATSSFDTLLGAYTGTAVDSLTEVASNDDFGDGVTSRVRFAAASGTVYRIRVDGFGGDSGTINLHLHQDPPPANDNFASAFVLSGLSTSRSGDTNEGATLEAGEATTVAGSTGGASVWYSWTAPAAGQVTIDTATSGFNTLLGVYTGSAVNALTEVASNDDWLSGTTSQVTFAATMGIVYRIRVDGLNADTGTINLHLDEPPTPANDAFANATPLTGNNASRIGDTNAGATLEPGEAATVAGSPGGASVWYSWTAPDTGQVTIDTATSDFDTLLGVYKGSAVGSLTEVASNDDDDPAVTSRVVFPVTASTVYKIRVDGFAGDTGTINLHLAFATVPGVPTNVSATAGPAQVTVSWTVPASDGGSPITSYAVTSFVGGVARSTTSVGVVTQTTLTGLTNGTTYIFRVSAVNAVGAGAQSADSNAVTPMSVPDAPTLTFATRANASVALAWLAPGSNGGSAITSYTATASPGGATCTSSGLGCTVSGLTNGTSYSFTVTATNAVGTGPASNALSATPATVPGAPTLTSATAGNASVALAWSAPGSNGGSAITSYTATASPGGATCTGSGLGCTVSGLTNGTSYSFTVTATNAVGIGPASNALAATPVAPRFTLTVTRSGTGTGTVTSSVGAINCGAACAADFDAGSSVTLTATATSGSTFTGWSGACTGTGSCTITMDAAKAATATFSLQNVTPPITCVVPNVKGRPLATAKRRIAAAHCRTGKVTTARSRTVAKGKVISQSPRAGRRLARGSKVNLVVSRGKR